MFTWLKKHNPLALSAQNYPKEKYSAYWESVVEQTGSYTIRFYSRDTSALLKEIKGRERTDLVARRKVRSIIPKEMKNYRRPK